MEAGAVSTEVKIELFRKLAACGYSRLEITSFVNPKWVPQFADAAAFVEAALATKLPVESMAFVPNLKGLERLVSFSIPWATTFIATSETFNKKNVNATTSETLVELKSMVARAHTESRKIRIYVSTVFGCPYEGAVPLPTVIERLKQVAELGPDEIALGDTIGVALPDEVSAILTPLEKFFPSEKTALHFHNTYGLGLACAQTAYHLGIRKFDGSTGGIGGCPYAKGATGNLATDELAYLFYREHALTEFRREAIEATLKYLAGSMHLKVHSHLYQIIEKGAELYGVGAGTLRRDHAPD